MKQMRTLLRRFRLSEQGTLSVETVIVFPILLWAYGAMFVYWDVFKTINTNLKATYTIADMISREPDPMTPDYIDGLSGIYDYLMRTGQSGTIRVSVLSVNSDPLGGSDYLELEWSYGSGDMPAHTTLTNLTDTVPMMAAGDNLIIVETEMDWTPPTNFGLAARPITSKVFTSPRFVPQVLFNSS